jgi:hypothetical protein
MPIVCSDLINFVSGSWCNLNFCSLTCYFGFSSPVSCESGGIIFVSDFEAFEDLIKFLKGNSGSITIYIYL